MDKEPIKHYGVKGMHWGVHKNLIKNTATASTNLSRDPTKDYINMKVRKAGGLHAVSDEQLQRYLNRMGSEKRYKEFMDEEAKKRAAGYKALGSVLLTVGKIALPLLVGGFAGRAAGPTVTRTVSVFQKAIGQ